MLEQQKIITQGSDEAMINIGIKKIFLYFCNFCNKAENIVVFALLYGDLSMNSYGVDSDKEMR